MADEWDAATYQRVSAPQLAWGRRVVERIDHRTLPPVAHRHTGPHQAGRCGGHRDGADQHADQGRHDEPARERHRSLHPWGSERREA